MWIKKHKEEFEVSKKPYESVLLTFKGVDGWDVYNCSVPFLWKGKRHIYGRVERREEWANSHVRLFMETGKDEFTVLPECLLELEDPYIQKIKGAFIFGGTHTRKTQNDIFSYYGHFFRGFPEDLHYFTSGPNYMKDIRLVDLNDGRIGVFSRRRDEEAIYVGFTTIDSIDHLSTEVIAAATPLNLFEDGTWGGVNQAYLLSSGKVGCIAHYSFSDKSPTCEAWSVYTNFSFVFDVETRQVINPKIIGTKSSYPTAPAKIPLLEDCVFSSGIVKRADGKYDLYSGVADTCQGRITIDFPFEGYGEIVGDLNF
ncbi:unnamed protein product [Phytomonas sp. Hart1]|nr:unnamed protein product [Phytomonas sp. Hart1]|eukprot:CCW68383.1 unnamed protein product [Phytomonas sp. isolate Hart1]